METYQSMTQWLTEIRMEEASAPAAIQAQLSPTTILPKTSNKISRLYKEAKGAFDAGSFKALQSPMEELCTISSNEAIDICCAFRDHCIFDVLSWCLSDNAPLYVRKLALAFIINILQQSGSLLLRHYVHDIVQIVHGILLKHQKELGYLAFQCLSSIAVESTTHRDLVLFENLEECLQFYLKSGNVEAVCSFIKAICYYQINTPLAQKLRDMLLIYITQDIGTVLPTFTSIAKASESDVFLGQKDLFDQLFKNLHDSSVNAQIVKFIAQITANTNTIHNLKFTELAKLRDSADNELLLELIRVFTNCIAGGILKPSEFFELVDNGFSLEFDGIQQNIETSYLIVNLVLKSTVYELDTCLKRNFVERLINNFFYDDPSLCLATIGAISNLFQIKEAKAAFCEAGGITVVESLQESAAGELAVALETFVREQLSDESERKEFQFSILKTS